LFEIFLLLWQQFAKPLADYLLQLFSLLFAIRAIIAIVIIISAAPVFTFFLQILFPRLPSIPRSSF